MHEKTRFRLNCGPPRADAFRMAMTPPAVSVVMPVYQAADFLAEASESILAQTYRDLELIAVDDGLRDGSVACFAYVSSADRRSP
jgi:hypothetical protein